MRIEVDITSNADAILDALGDNVGAALEEIGLVAEGYAKRLCPVQTGNLRDNIAHDHDDRSAYIGTNVGYAPYVEFGTGIFAEGGGRSTPWSYQDDDGNWHTTRGNKPQPFLRPAAENHAEEYKSIALGHLKGD